MIPKIQGSTQMPARIEVPETDTAQTSKSKDRSELQDGPPTSGKDQERTAQPANPAERKFEAHALAVDLNAKLNTINGAPPNSSAFKFETVFTTKLDSKKAETEESKGVSNVLFDNTPMDEVVFSAISETPKPFDNPPATSNAYTFTDVFVESIKVVVPEKPKIEE